MCLAAYRSGVAATEGPSPARSKVIGSKAKAILIYTSLRVGLFALIWVIVDLLTPVHGVAAAIVAVLISGALSIVVLDRQRGAVGEVAAGFFGRINSRIEASARAEDGDDLAEPQGGSEQKAVDQQ